MNIKIDGKAIEILTQAEGKRKMRVSLGKENFEIVYETNSL